MSAFYRDKANLVVIIQNGMFHEICFPKPAKQNDDDAARIAVCALNSSAIDQQAVIFEMPNAMQLSRFLVLDRSRAQASCTRPEVGLDIKR